MTDSINRASISITIYTLLLIMVSSCSTNSGMDDHLRGFEIYKENDGGSYGLVLINDNRIATFNDLKFSIFDRNGNFIRQVNNDDKHIDQMAAHGEYIFAAEKMSDSSHNNIIISAYSDNGDPVWSTQLDISANITHTIALRVVDEKVVLVATTTPDSDTPVTTVFVHHFILSLGGDLISEELNQIESPVAIYTNNIFIDDTHSYLIQASKVASESTDNDILIYSFEMGQNTWMTETGVSGFNTVTNIRSVPGGGFLFVGSRQAQGWAFLLNSNGELQWEKSFGIDTGKNWFYDAVFSGNEIRFAGYTNVTEQNEDKGWFVRTGLDGSFIEEFIYGNELHHRIYAITSAHPDELIMVGIRRHTTSNRVDSWLFNRDISGNAFE